MSAWEYTVGGSTTPTTVRTDAEGNVKTVVVDIDLYGTQYIGNPERPPSGAEWDEEREEYFKFGNGATAELRFSVTDGEAELDGFKEVNNKPRSDWFELRWMALLPAAERIVRNVQGVHSVVPPEESINDMIELGFGANVEHLS